VKKILVTGSNGYIGTELCKKLSELNFEVVGVDNNYFASCKITDTYIDDNQSLDIRSLSIKYFHQVDAVIHLAALSNDPLGELNPNLTYQINRDAAINTAALSKKAGVKKFIFISTQSIYGISMHKELLKENAEKNPITAYAKAKWDAEQEILSLNSNDFCAIALRPATVFGWGSRIRNDIIFNNLLMSGLKTGVISVHTDGKPSRPVVHVLDLVDCIIKLTELDSKSIGGEAFNVGLWEGNYSVKEIASIAASCLGKIPILFGTEEVKDSRSYKVDVCKIYDAIGFKATTNLNTGGEEIISNFNRLNEKNKLNYFDKTIRIEKIKQLLENALIDENLSWIKH
jgi:nucleoside-diphosphate-sugar epimerase